MKKLSLIAIAISMTLFVGCSDDNAINSIVGSQDTEKTEDTLSVFSDGGEEYYMGLLPTPDDQYESFPRATVQMSRALPRRVDLSGKMPTPGNQGRQNSCTAWAAGYAYKSYQERLDHNRNLTFSPSYIYNQTNGGKNVGIYMHTPFQLLERQGVCTFNSMRYNQSDWRTQPNQAQRNEARRYKARSWGTIASGSVQQIKAHLATGDPVAVGVPVYNDINVSNSNPVYDRMDGRFQGNHAICLVGYDDSKQAFKFMNSWGTRWGFRGFGWISYDMIVRNRVKGYVMTDVKTGGNDDGNDTVTPISSWSSQKAYYRGNKVKFSGAIWICQRNNRNRRPSNSSSYFWKKQGGNDTTPSSNYQHSNAYPKGSVVIYNGRKYIAQWWTKGEVPGSKSWGAWKAI